MKKWMAGVLVMVAGSALAVSWVPTDSGTYSWFDAANWGGTLPASGTTALIKNSESTVVIATQDATASLVQVGRNGFGPTLQVESGSLTSGGTLLVGFLNYRVGAFEQTGGAVSVGNVTVGQKTNADGTLTVSGGTFDSAGNIIIGSAATGHYTQSGGTVGTDASLIVGNAAGGVGDAAITSGTLNVRDLDMDGAGIGTFNANGGTVNVSRDFLLGGTVGGTFDASLNGATVNVAGQMATRSAGMTFAFNSGTLKVNDMAWNGDLSVGNGTDSATLILQANADEHVVNADVLSINNNASLFGAGTLTGGAAGKNVSIGAGGLLSAGEGQSEIGTFEIGLNQSLSLADGAVIDFEADGSGSDQITVLDTLAFAGGTISLKLDDLGGADFSQDMVLMTYGALSGFDSTAWSINADGVAGYTGADFTVLNDTDSNSLVLSVIPEPAAMGLIMSSCGVLLFLKRRFSM
ncbi:hypothetical protein P4B35_10835 [Pontiellaceae bacterium B12227]|nr:hypothetical protein [Pontiellaceae bacterium B12227]